MNDSFLLRQYRQRLEDSVRVYAGSRRSIRESRKAARQIIPDSILEQVTATDDTKDAENDGYANQIMHPGLTYITKKFIEDLTALPPRYEWQANNAEGEIAREALELRFRTLYSRSTIAARMRKAYAHAVIDGLIVGQAYTYKDGEQVVMPDGSLESLNERREISINIYDPLRVYIDPNCDMTDIVNTSEYIIVTIGVFDRAYVEKHYPAFFEEAPGIPQATQLSRVNPALATVAWLDDGEDEASAAEAGVDRSSLERYKIREYYDRSGFYYVVINDVWVSPPKQVSNGIYGRIPFIIIQTMPDLDNQMGQTMFDYLRMPLIMASKGLNSIADNTDLNNNMPFFTYNGSGVDGLTINSMEPNIILPLNKVSEVNDIKNMIYRPQVTEVTQGSATLLSKGEEFMYLLTGLSPQFITGQQDPQLRTNGIARMMQQAATRSQNNIARQIELFQNTLLWDWTRIFYVYYDDFGFNSEVVPRDFFSKFDNIRVVPGSYLPEDQMTRIERAQTVLNLALSAPDAYEVTKVHKDFLRAIGVSVPDSVLKGPIELMKEQLAMAIAQQLGSETANSKEIQAMLDQLAQLAATNDEDMR